MYVQCNVAHLKPHVMCIHHDNICMCRFQSIQYSITYVEIYYLYVHLHANWNFAAYKTQENQINITYVASYTV